VVAAGGLILFARRLGVDSEATRRSARVAMNVVYALVAALGVGFAVYALVATPVQYKTLVQAVIFVLLGSGGLVMNNRRR